MIVQLSKEEVLAAVELWVLIKHGMKGTKPSFNVRVEGRWSTPVDLSVNINDVTTGHPYRTPDQ